MAQNPETSIQELATGGRIGFAIGSGERQKRNEIIKKVYNKLKKELKRFPTKAELARVTPFQIADINMVEKLEFFNKPGISAVPKDVLQKANIKGTEVKRAKKVITEPTLRDGKLIFPDKEMEKEFKAQVKKKYKYPRDSVAAQKAGVLTQKDFYKKFYKTAAPSTTVGHIGIMAEELDLGYPKQTYEGDLKQKKILEKRRTDLISDVSGKPQERQIVKAKREAGLGKFGKNLDLAHRASLKQLKDLGGIYLAENLGLDTRKVNQEILPPLEKEANSLHKQRMKLIKGLESGNVPKDISKKLEAINIKLSNISLKTNGALQAVLIDEKTLKPFVFNKNYANVIGQGLIEKPVKDLTKADIDFIKKTFPQEGGEAKTINKLSSALKAIGCPGKAMGGRIGFQTGANCLTKGVEAINSGKFAKGAQSKNVAKFLNSAYKLGRGVMKFGVIPEALFVAGESLVRMGMGDNLDEAFLRATDYLRPGDQTKEANLKMLTRTIGSENAQTVLRANDYKESLQRLNDAKSSLEQNQMVLDDSEFGYTANIDSREVLARDEKKVQEAEADMKAKFQPEAVMDYATMQESEAEDIRKSNSKIRKFMETARQTEVDDFEQVATPEKVKRAADPMFTMDELSNYWIPDEFLKSEQDRMGAPELKKRNLFDYYRGDESFNKDVWKAVMEGGRSNLANRERLFGTQGTFGGQPLANGGIAGLMKKYYD